VPYVPSDCRIQLSHAVVRGWKDLCGVPNFRLEVVVYIFDALEEAQAIALDFRTFKRAPDAVSYRPMAFCTIKMSVGDVRKIVTSSA
jgi:hypothetical protein